MAAFMILTLFLAFRFAMGAEVPEITSTTALVTETCFTDEKTWARLLECSVEATTECRIFISEVSRLRSHDHTAELAAILIEEWDSPSDKQFEEPRLVWIPPLTIAELEALLPPRIEWSIVIVTGVVDRQGRVNDVRLLRPSRYKALNDLVISTFSRACYRPARTEDCFLSKEVRFSFSIEPREE